LVSDGPSLRDREERCGNSVEITKSVDVAERWRHQGVAAVTVKRYVPPRVAATLNSSGVDTDLLPFPLPSLPRLPSLLHLSNFNHVLSYSSCNLPPPLNSSWEVWGSAV